MRQAIDSLCTRFQAFILQLPILDGVFKHGAGICLLHFANSQIDVVRRLVDTKAGHVNVMSKFRTLRHRFFGICCVAETRKHAYESGIGGIYEFAMGFAETTESVGKGSNILNVIKRCRSLLPMQARCKEPTATKPLGTGNYIA